MAIEREVRYNINAKNNTDAAFKDVEKNSQQTTDKIKKAQDEIAKGADKIANAFKKESKDIQSIFKTMGSAITSPFKTAYKVIMTTIKGMLKLVIAAGTVVSAIRAIEWISKKTGHSLGGMVGKAAEFTLTILKSMPIAKKYFSSLKTNAKAVRDGFASLDIMFTSGYSGMRDYAEALRFATAAGSPSKQIHL